MIRVLIAEDSSTVRRLLVEILSADPEVSIVGEAKDGLSAVEMTRKLRPDVITMDVAMPGIDGLEATRIIMSEVPTPVVILSANFDPKDVEKSFLALDSGALTVARKLEGPGSADFETACRQLLRTVKSMAQVKVVRRSPILSMPLTPTKPLRVWSGEPPRVIALAASVGGPAALHSILSMLPPSFPVPLLVVQHITNGFAAGLASWLGHDSGLKIRMAEHQMTLEPGHLYIAPDGMHMGVSSQTKLALSSAPPIGGFRPSASYLFSSVAAAFGSAMVAVILTGMGQDGLAGLHAVHQAGGRIIAQDEKSCVVFGMPGAAVAAGLPDQILSLGSIGPQLLGFFQKPEARNP